jgi:glycosyltransferase involved in cell wall biosynthesis
MSPDTAAANIEHTTHEQEITSPSPSPDNTPFPFTVTVVIPAYNEGASIAHVLQNVQPYLPQAEFLVVDDASRDDTAHQAAAAGARVVSHPLNKGNGAAVKTGLRNATGEVVLLMDADGQMDPTYIQPILSKLAEGYDMVVAARTPETQGDSGARRAGNAALNRLGSYLVDTAIPDLTSGYRAVRRAVILEFIHLLPNSYSYPTTSTLALIQAGYSVGFLAIPGQRRQKGKSQQKLFRNGVRFGLIILRMISLFAPLRVYFPLALLMEGLALLSFAISFFITDPGRFYIPNSAVGLFVGGIIIFMFGLLAEQVAALRIKRE